MGDLSKFMKGLGAVLGSPELISAVLHDQRYWKSQFRKEFGHIQTLPTMPINSIVPNEASLEEYNFAGDSSMITDLLVLKYLAQRKSIQSYFEIGTWRGESARTVAPFVERVVTLDLPADVMRKRGFDPGAIDQVGVFLEGLDNVTSVRHDSSQANFRELDGPFDLIFIDGDHRAEFVERDTANVFKHLCHEDTIVVWHDYGFDPENVRWEVYYGIMKGIPDPEGLCSISHTKCAITGIATNTTFKVESGSSWNISLKRNT